MSECFNTLTCYRCVFLCMCPEEPLLVLISWEINSRKKLSSPLGNAARVLLSKTINTNTLHWQTADNCV